VGASAVIAIAGYLRGRIRRARQSKVQPQLDLIHGRPDGTFLRVAGTDTDAVLKAFYASLATSAADPTAKEALLRLAAGADPSAELKALKPKRLPLTQKTRLATRTTRTKQGSCWTSGTSSRAVTDRSNRRQIRPCGNRSRMPWICRRTCARPPSPAACCAS
jgi:hypothetical protein